MARYMKNQFPFFGLAAPERRRVTRELLRGLSRPSGQKLEQTLRGLWAEPERELQYLGVDLARRYQKVLADDNLELARWLIETRSWWDTVDALAAHLVGPLVTSYPHRWETVDRFVEDENLWIQRTALLFQLNFKERTDFARLSRYIDRLGHRPEFFLRKAIGWALREYAKIDPQAVLALVDSNPGLSPLSRREALKGIKKKPVFRPV